MATQTLSTQSAVFFGGRDTEEGSGVMVGVVGDQAWGLVANGATAGGE
jgi:hypothetical protein